MHDGESAQVSAVAELTSATVPAVPDIAIVPVACAGGNGCVPPVPCASAIR